MVRCVPVDANRQGLHSHVSVAAARLGLSTETAPVHQTKHSPFSKTTTIQVRWHDARDAPGHTKGALPRPPPHVGLHDHLSSAWAGHRPLLLLRPWRRPQQPPASAAVRACVSCSICGLSSSNHLEYLNEIVTPTLPKNPTIITQRPQTRSLRFLAHALTVLAAAQLLAGVGLSYMWSGIKRGVEAVRVCVGWPSTRLPTTPPPTQVTPPDSPVSPPPFTTHSTSPPTTPRLTPSCCAWAGPGTSPASRGWPPPPSSSSTSTARGSRSATAAAQQGPAPSTHHHHPSSRLPSATTTTPTSTGTACRATAPWPRCPSLPPPPAPRRVERRRCAPPHVGVVALLLAIMAGRAHR